MFFILYPLKTENICFCCAFKEYKMQTLLEHALTH